MYKKAVLVGFVSLLLSATMLHMVNSLVIVSALGLPENEVELVISNPLNVTRVNEAFLVPIENLSLSVEARPESLRIINAEGREVPYQLDNLTLYEYDAYLVFPVTVEASSNATYHFFYSTEPDWSPPNYTAAVPITETETEYTFTTDTYSGRINKTNGEFYFLTTSHSGNLLLPYGLYDGKYTIPNRGACGFSSSSLLGTAWEYGWFQMGIDDASTTLLKQGPIRSIIIVEGKLWYSPGFEGEPKPPSGWKFRTIYMLYEDRVEALTHQVYEGTKDMQLAQVRVGTTFSQPWVLNATVMYDGPSGPVKRTVGVPTPWFEWDINIYPERDIPFHKTEFGRWMDVTSTNQSFGFGMIFYDSAEIDRISLFDGRTEDIPEDYVELQIMQFSAQGSGGVKPGFEALYHWAILPHEDVNYTYTQKEAEKAYNPLVLYARATLKGGAFPWLIVGVTAATGIALATLVLSMKRRSVNNPSKKP